MFLSMFLKGQVALLDEECLATEFLSWWNNLYYTPSARWSGDLV